MYRPPLHPTLKLLSGFCEGEAMVPHIHQSYYNHQSINKSTTVLTQPYNIVGLCTNLLTNNFFYYIIDSSPYISKLIRHFKNYDNNRLFVQFKIIGIAKCTYTIKIVKSCDYFVALYNNMENSHHIRNSNIRQIPFTVSLKIMN